MKKKSGLMLTAMLSLGMLLAGCGSEEGASSGGGSSEEGKTFKVGMEAGYAPFNWTQSDDSNGAVKISGNAEYAGGYDVEIAKQIAEDLGMELEIVKTEWDGLVPALNSARLMPSLRACPRQQNAKKPSTFPIIITHRNW